MAQALTHDTALGWPSHFLYDILCNVEKGFDCYIVCYAVHKLLKFLPSAVANTHKQQLQQQQQQHRVQHRRPIINGIYGRGSPRRK